MDELKSVASVSINSQIVHDCRSSLNEMTEQFNIHLIWVPGHRDIPGNCKADELAKNGTLLPNVRQKHNIGTPLAHLLSSQTICSRINKC